MYAPREAPASMRPLTSAAAGGGAGAGAGGSGAVGGGWRWSASTERSTARTPSVRLAPKPPSRPQSGGCMRLCRPCSR
eukprot:scaffold35727_cov43-Phaeocystis_antarctica.AAC.4